ncbi:MAG: TM2 domain-containing protein [Bacteroidales bacterium]|nr:TM2 domain-containing protein [Bacteroidales bacterium]
MKRFFLLFVAIFALSTVTFADKYEINDADVDALFATATQVSSQEINAFGTGALMMANSAANAAYLNAPNPWAAFALCWFFGGFGIHRHYMGTKSSMWAIYTFTCGGIFGVVPFVDWVVLLIGAADGNIRPYVNNKKFFMWM